MKLKFGQKKITGILTVFPEKEIKFEDEIDNYDFTRQQSMKLKKVMGFNKRRVVSAGTSVSDLCVYGLNYLFEQKLLEKEDIDALVLVTQSPDYFMPATSHVIHGMLGLKEDIYLDDITQGCAGYSFGLNKAFMLLEQESINKVVVLNADILSLKVSKKDRSSAPLTGDGATVTVVENDPAAKSIYGEVKADGSGVDALVIPAGGFKLPSNEKTAILEKDKAGNLKALDNISMKGDEVFNFVQREVPPMIDSLLSDAGSSKEDVDYFMFHQPNKFMVKQLSNLMGISEEKMPNNLVENYGNSASVTIPALICHNLGNKILDSTYLFCLCGFGNGLSWSSLLMEIGEVNFCKTIEYEK